MNKKLILLTGILLVFTMLAAQTSSVMAALRSCRTDPIVFLKDGTKVTLTSTINTDPANIIRVDYILHAPQGAQAGKVLFTASGIGIPETFKLIDDQLPGQYYSETSVMVIGSPVSFTSYLTLPNGRVQAESGMTGVSLRVNNTPLDLTALKKTK